MATAQGPGLTGLGDVPCAMMATITLPPAPRRGVNASARLAPGDIAKRKHRVRIGQPVSCLRAEDRGARPISGLRQSVPQCRCRGKALARLTRQPTRRTGALEAEGRTDLFPAVSSTITYLRAQG